MKKICSHRWRVGGTIVKFRLDKRIPIGIHIWCEDCKKVIQAKHDPYDHYPKFPKKYQSPKKPKQLNNQNNSKGGIENGIHSESKSTTIS